MSMIQFNLRSILNNNRLVGPNYSNWLKNLKLILRFARIEYVLEKDLPPVPLANASQAQQDAYKKHQDDAMQAQVLMLASMSNELQKQHETMNPKEMFAHLQDLFGAYSCTERYLTSKELFRCKMSEGASVHSHVLYMIGLIEKLVNLGFEMNHELSVDLILQSLPDSYSQFVLNFHMKKLSATLPELANMLSIVELNIKKDKGQVLVSESFSKKSKKKAQKAKSIKTKGAIQKGKGKMVQSHVNDTCHHCGKKGHWKRNCKVYLKEVKKKKAASASESRSLAQAEEE